MHVTGTCMLMGQKHLGERPVAFVLVVFATVTQVMGTCNVYQHSCTLRNSNSKKKCNSVAYILIAQLYEAREWT